MVNPYRELFAASGSRGFAEAGLLFGAMKLRTPLHRLLLQAGLNVGVALGAAASGQIVDDAAAQAGFAIARGAGALVLLLALLGYLRLRASGLSLSLSLSVFEAA
ncbi:MAG: hypothetical protein ACREXO_04985 [Advenella sp.]